MTLVSSHTASTLGTRTGVRSSARRSLASRSTSCALGGSGPRGGRRTTTPVESAKVTFEWPSPIGVAARSPGASRPWEPRNSRKGSSTKSGSRVFAAASACVRTTSSGASVTLMPERRLAALTSIQMPELPEVEITARLIDSAVGGERIGSALAPGINALKTFDPPLAAVEGRAVERVSRRGKLFLIGVEEGLVLLVHLMSAGRLQLFDDRASPRDRTARLLLRLGGGRELRLREFGTRQRAWVKVLRSAELEHEETLAELWPEAWAEPPEFGPLLDQPRPLHALLRDQHVIAGIGRSWVDELLHTAMLSPFKRGSDLDAEEAERLRAATVSELGRAIEHYEDAIRLPIADKLPMPLSVHRRAGEPCPRCGDRLEAVFYEDYVMCYCPPCQTEGKLLKDRRLSRLLK